MVPTMSKKKPDTLGVPPLQIDQLRWQCDPAIFKFECTDEIAPIGSVVGQDAAIDALRFGLESTAHGQNIYVRGLSGTGRMTLIRRLLEEIKPACPLALDRVYVRNFEDPMRPKLISLPRGQAMVFSRAIDRLISFIDTDLGQALGSDPFKSRMKALQQATEEGMRNLAKPLDEALAKDDLALVTITAGQTMRPAIIPRIGGKPVTPEVFEQERAKGNIPDAAYNQLRGAIEARQEDLSQLASQTRQMMEKHLESSRKLLEDETRSLLNPICAQIQRQFSEDRVREFLNGIINDLVENQLDEIQGEKEFTDQYKVNALLCHGPDDDCPTIVENAPSRNNLVGGIELQQMMDKYVPPDHMSIRGGALLNADGGYLILEARDVLSEPGAWPALIRTIRTGRLTITSDGPPWLASMPQIKPEPIDVTIKVILIGDPQLFFYLDQLDPDFSQLFKVLAEFDTVIPRSDESLQHYAAVIKRISDEDSLPAFSCEAVAALAEHGSRIAGRQDRLTTRFSRLADIAREAGFLANKAGRTRVSDTDIRETVVRTKRRADLSSRKFRELIAAGTIRIYTKGEAVGQINGLAVLNAGPLTYGFPARITASIGPGSAGVINIERESKLSGAIHTKGFLILGGLLRTLLQADHPLAFSCSIAFEQSYGGIDGDSASGAEACCMLSALTQIPIRQDLAMTGAIDQTGNVLAIGGVNEKIEGFFDVCSDIGLSGTQGVIIPESNTRDLMLREDVVEACRNDKFSVYAVSTIHQALELLLRRPSGISTDGSPPAQNTILAQARQRAREFWTMSVQRKSVGE